MPDGKIYTRVVEEAQDIICGLRRQEKDPNYISCDYLSNIEESTCVLGIHDLWRTRMCEWSYELIDHFDCDRCLVGIAFDYIDRFLSFTTKRTSGGHEMSKQRFQLLVVTSVFIALKLNRSGKKHLMSKHSSNKFIDEFVLLSNGVFSANDFYEMEIHLLKTLKWRVNPPTPASYIFHLLSFFPIQNQGTPNFFRKQTFSNHRSDFKFSMTEGELQEIYDCASYISELVVGYYEIFTLQSPSCIAAAAIIRAIDIVLAQTYASKKLLFEKVMTYMTLDTKEQLLVQKVCQQIETLYPNLFIEEELNLNVKSDRTDGFSHFKKRILSPTSVVGLNQVPEDNCKRTKT